MVRKQYTSVGNCLACPFPKKQQEVVPYHIHTGTASVDKLILPFKRSLAVSPSSLTNLSPIYTGEHLAFQLEQPRTRRREACPVLTVVQQCLYNIANTIAA